MKKQFGILAALTLMAGLAIIAVAGNRSQGRQPNGRRPAFSNVDKNNDAKISREEWRGPAELFDRMDANRDGNIVESEWNSAAPPLAFRGDGGSFGGRLLKALDADLDGNVSQAEFGRITGYFNSLDQDKDGALIAEELGRFPQVIGDGRAERAGSRVPGRSAPPSFAELDADSNKKVTREEWQGPPQAFDRIDANGDGFIEEAEWTGARQRLPRGGPEVLGDRLRNFLDSDDDGKVSSDEFARLSGLFGSLDADGSGTLDDNEVRQFFRAVGESGK